MLRHRFTILLILATVIFTAGAILGCPAQAYQIADLSQVPVSGDFVVGPSKVELAVNPGESTTTNLIILNRFGDDLRFTVGAEDIATSTQNAGTVDLLGGKLGVYSLKNFIRPEVSSFVLRQGEQMTLPISVIMPDNAQPGGLYGAVTVAATPANQKAGSISVTSRLASLFFVRVKGAAIEAGALQDFSSQGSFYWSGPFKFDSYYKNTGSVYLNPYGHVAINSLWGQEICKQQIPPYFVLPGAVRQQQLTLDCHSYPGIYRANIKLNRGYSNNVDEKSIYFIVCPWPYLAAVCLLVILLLARVISVTKNKSK